jgi:hypothetical protein
MFMGKAQGKGSKGGNMEVLHADLAISMVERSRFFYHNLIKIQDHGVVSLVDTNPTS